MKIVVLFALCVLTQPPADKKPSKRDNPKTAIKAVLEEASDLYKKHIKAYQSCKTSAEKTNALETAKEAFEEWIETVDSVPVTMDCRILDIAKNKDTDAYYVSLEQGKELLKFAGKMTTPTNAATKFYLEITEEKSKTLKIGQRLTITGTMSPTPSYIVDESGYARESDATASRLKPVPDGVVCLFLLNYSSVVFSEQNYNYYTKPADYITFVLDEATIVFDDKKP